MSKFIHKVMLGAMALLSVGLLASCGSKSTGSANGKHQLTFMFRGGDAEKKAYGEAIKAYEKAHKDVSVKIIMTSADNYATKLQAAISGNKTPDVFYVEQNNLMAYADNGVLRDISKDVKDSKVDLNNIWKYGVDSYRYDGKQVGKGNLYALPKDVGPFALGYNKTMFEKNNIPLPDKDKAYTWEEFVKVAQKLTKDTNGDGKIDQYGTGFNVVWSLPALAWSNGADWINKDKTKVTVNTPKFAHALQEFADLQNKYHTTPSVKESQSLDTYQRWMQGQLAFFPVGPWDLPTYSKLKFDYDLIPWPTMSTGKPAAYVGSLGIGVSKKTKYGKDAADLAIYLSTNRKAQQILVDNMIQIPTLKDMANKWANEKDHGKPENRQEFLDIVEKYGRGLPGATTYNAEWYDMFYTDIQPVLDGKKTAAQFVKEEQPKMQSKLDAANQQKKTAEATAGK